jgi:hypothetical protein
MPDKEQIGLTPAGAQIVERLLGTGLFGGKDEIARFAAAVAMRAQLPPTPAKGASTVWHTKGIDAAGELAVAISLLYGDVDEPYRALEGLIDAGLASLDHHMDKMGDLVVSDLIALGP